MFGISGTEFIILAVITFFVIGPERMPEYARQIREFVKTVRRMAFDAKDALRKPWGETGLEDINWRQIRPPPVRSAPRCEAGRSLRMIAEREREAQGT